MINLLKNRLKEQKGFTLIELLAVIVILGIILAIAIPAVSNLINNSRIDAHISNAQQIESSAKLYFADNPTAKSVDLATLISKNLLEQIEDPHDKGYSGTATKVEKVVPDAVKSPNGYATTVASDDVTYLTGKSASKYERGDFDLGKKL